MYAVVTCLKATSISTTTHKGNANTFRVALDDFVIKYTLREITAIKETLPNRTTGGSIVNVDSSINGMHQKLVKSMILILENWFFYRGGLLFRCVKYIIDKWDLESVYYIWTTT